MNFNIIPNKFYYQVRVILTIFFLDFSMVVKGDFEPTDAMGFIKVTGVR